MDNVLPLVFAVLAAALAFSMQGHEDLRWIELRNDRLQSFCIAFAAFSCIFYACSCMKWDPYGPFRRLLDPLRAPKGVFREMDLGTLNLRNLEPFMGAAVEEVSLLDLVLPFLVAWGSMSFM